MKQGLSAAPGYGSCTGGSCTSSLEFPCYSPQGLSAAPGYGSCTSSLEFPLDLDIMAIFFFFSFALRLSAATVTEDSQLIEPAKLQSAT